jgi:hypothetical protein
MGAWPTPRVVRVVGIVVRHAVASLASDRVVVGLAHNRSAGVLPWLGLRYLTMSVNDLDGVIRRCIEAKVPTGFGGVASACQIPGPCSRCGAQGELVLEVGEHR